MYALTRRRERVARLSGTRSVGRSDLVKVAYVHDQSEAELVQGLLRSADVHSVVRRAAGFDVPEFLAAGPRDVLVTAADVPIAREVLLQIEPDDPALASTGGAARPARILAALLIVAALLAFIVGLAADVLS